MRKLFGTPVILLLASVVSWSAAQALAAAPQSDKQSRSEKPSQSQPAPDNGTVQGSQTPSTTQAAPENPAPSQAVPPSQAGPSSNAPAARTPAQAASIEDELQLTPDQKQKISAIVDDENRQIAAVREDQSLTMDQKIQKVQEIRKVGAPKIKAVLTPEQLQKLAAIQERARQQQQQQNNQAAPPPKQ